MKLSWTIHDATDFASLAPRWDALNAARFRSPLLHSDFVAAAIAHFAPRGLRVAFASDGDRPVAAAVVARSKALAVDVFQPSQSPVALWVEDGSRPVLADPEALRALAATFGPTAAVVNVSQVDPEMVSRPPGSERVTTSDAYASARVTVAGSFDDYWAARGKNLRANMKKQRNRLESEGVALRFDCVTAPDDVAGAIADYGRLESAGWKAAGGTAVSPDNAQGRFYRELFERFAARGQARIHRCFYGDRLAAMDLCVAHAGVLVILKTSFDETIKGTSPALLMRHDYFPPIFATRAFDRIEFYGRVMDWHTKWTDEVRMLYHVTAYRAPWIAKLDTLRRARRSAAPPVETEAVEA